MSVRKRGDRWWYDFTIDGVRYRKPIPEARTKRKAEKVEDEVKVSIYNGTYGQPSTRTLAEFIEEVFKPWARTNYRSAPRKYESAVKLIGDRLGHIKLSDLAPLTIERWKRERLAEPTRRGKGRTPQAVNRELTLLSRILRMAVDCGLLRENPVRAVKWFKGGESRMRYMTDEEEELVLAWLDLHRPQSANAVRVALGTGMRRGEILALHWSDLDFARRIIQIKTSKTGKPRVVPMNKAVEDAFSSQRQLCAGADRVFTVCAEHVTASFRKASRQCNLADVRFHDTRHRAATRMGAAGTDAFTIAELLGHSSIKQTRTYTHALDSAKRRAVESLERLAAVTNLSQRWLAGAK
ncbi:MAG TPA: site-specific integrase [Blastocatellia bacterium]|nr:site-specific integrase [Blastocatellia bacterium]